MTAVTKQPQLRESGGSFLHLRVPHAARLLKTDISESVKCLQHWNYLQKLLGSRHRSQFMRGAPVLIQRTCSSSRFRPPTQLFAYTFSHIWSWSSQTILLWPFQPSSSLCSQHPFKNKPGSKPVRPSRRVGHSCKNKLEKKARVRAAFILGWLQLRSRCGTRWRCDRLMSVNGSTPSLSQRLSP